MSRLEIYIPGKPISWSRPGQSRSRRYDTQRGIKDQLGCIILNAIARHSTLQGKIQLKATYYYQKPKSKHIRDFDYALNLCDLDNLLKFSLDLCQEYGCFKNDRQVCRIVAEKQYRSQGPGTFLEFTQMGDWDGDSRDM